MERLPRKEKREEPVVLLVVSPEEAFRACGLLLNMFNALFFSLALIKQENDFVGAAQRHLLTFNNWWRGAISGGKKTPDQSNVWQLGASLGTLMSLTAAVSKIAVVNRTDEATEKARTLTNLFDLTKMLCDRSAKAQGIDDERTLRRFYHGAATMLIRSGCPMTDFIVAISRLPGNPVLAETTVITLGGREDNVFYEDRDGARKMYAGVSGTGMTMVSALVKAKVTALNNNRSQSKVDSQSVPNGQALPA